jgi:hypothetical protein
MAFLAAVPFLFTAGTAATAAVGTTAAVAGTAATYAGLTAAAWGTTAALVSTGLTVASSVSKARTAKAAGKFNAAKLRNDAMQKEAIGRLNITRQRAVNERYLSTMRAKFAAAGVQLQGSPLAVLGSTAGQLETDIADMAFSANAQASALYQSASLTSAEAKSESSAGYLGAATAAFNGLSGLGSQLIDIKSTQPGTPPLES